VTEPTLTIQATPNLAGGYMSTKPRGVFVGVGMTIEGTFVIPDGGPPLVHKASSWRTPNMAVFREEGAEIADVYQDMAMTGYDRFAHSFLKHVFKEPPNAGEAPPK
jgi:hypothetical protein